MESLQQKQEHREEWRGIPIPPLLASIMLHALLLAGLVTLVEPARQQPARSLEARLLPSAGQGAAAAAAERPVPVRAAAMPARSPATLSVQEKGFSPVKQTVDASIAAAGSAPGSAASPVSVAGVAPNAAPVAEVVERGPDAAGLRQYRVTLASEARRLRKYPEAARRAGLSGTAEVRVVIESGGALRRADLFRTSGHALLDSAAVEMLGEAAARASLPDSLRGLNFAVLLPVVFEVED